MINRNVYFLLGCPCSGKTTVGTLLSEKYDMHCFSGDAKRFHYYKLADDNKHKYMKMDTSDFWDWSLAEMIAWEKGVISEQTPMILEDLNKLSYEYKYVLFEGMMDMSYLSRMISKEQAVYLTVDRDVCEREFFERLDHSAMVDSINKETGVPDAEKIRRIEIRKQAAINAFYENASDHGIQCFSRNNMSSPLEMVTVVENYFGLQKDTPEY
ncbi:MAG: hypothetical protein J6X60_02495 [Ruminiclostridium sp.]|nr:hypothetical protein [Ruminiclostridium sp.]